MHLVGESRGTLRSGTSLRAATTLLTTSVCRRNARLVCICPLLYPNLLSVTEFPSVSLRLFGTQDDTPNLEDHETLAPGLCPACTLGLPGKRAMHLLAPYRQLRGHWQVSHAWLCFLPVCLSPVLAPLFCYTYKHGRQHPVCFASLSNLSDF